MCGIVGLVSLSAGANWQSKESFVERALFVDTLRGFDSTGIFCVPYAAKDKDPISYKRALPGYDFLGLKKTRKLLNEVDKYFALVGHNRAATQGMVRDETSHPYTHENITLVHNGTLISRNGLQGTQQFAVDSEDICYSLAKAEDPKTVLETLHGAYALVWYDSDTQCLHLTRNQERTLFFAFSKDHKNLFFASEAWMLSAAVSPIFDLEKIHLLKTGIIMSVPANLQKLSDYTIEEYKEYVAPVQYVSNGYGYYDKYYPAKSNMGRSDILNEYGYYYRERIKFTVNEVRLYQDKCTLIGTTKPINGFPPDNVVAYQVPIVMFTGEKNPSAARLLDLVKVKTLIAEANYATVNGGKIEIKVENVQVFVPSSHVEPEDVALEAPLKPRDKVMGPDNDFITVRKFNKLVKNGCAYCTGDILPQDADEVLWTSDNSPICPDCTEYYVDDDEVATLQ